MSEQTQVPTNKPSLHGWHRVFLNDQPHTEVWWIEHGVVVDDYNVESFEVLGYRFEPVIVLTPTEHAALTQAPASDIANAERPRIVCLCGSTRFWREFQRASLAETLAGKIVLSIGAASGTDDEHFGNLPRDEYDRVKAMLDQLHLRKIDMADEVLILNVGGYIGESTSRELAYARRLGKVVRFLEDTNAPQST